GHFLTVVGTFAGLAGLVLAGTVLSSRRVRADDENSSSDRWRIEQGLQIAPVPLSYDKHDRDLVGLGSYLVNGAGDCNGCHSAGPATQWTPGHNPYQRAGLFTPPKIESPTTYLAGGRDFGQIGPISSPMVPPHIVSRNLRPDNSGLPAQGASFAEFFGVIRTGVDPDHLHPNCNGTTITTNCFNAPFNGDLLQVMPWPAFQ